MITHVGTVNLSTAGQSGGVACGSGCGLRRQWRASDFGPDLERLGLAPLIVREIFAIIQAPRRDGVSILLVEQNARAALEISGHDTVTELGPVTRSGPVGALLEDDGLIESHLGLRRENAA